MENPEQMEGTEETEAPVAALAVAETVELEAPMAAVAERVMAAAAEMGEPMAAVAVDLYLEDLALVEHMEEMAGHKKLQGQREILLQMIG